MNSFDITVIGSGPGGYVAAIRAAQLGYSVALIEKYTHLGGTCTNVGCIPSKALLDSSEHYQAAHKKFKDYGIRAQDISMDVKQLFLRKEKVVHQNTSGIRFLMNKHKIIVWEGTGKILGTHEVSVRSSEGKEERITSDYIIIATGSKPSTRPGITIDKDRIITSTEALSLEKIPKSMTIIGGGVIGAELASVYARLGTKVIILEYADTLIPSMDKELGRELARVLRKQDIEIITNVKVTTALNKGNTTEVKALSAEGVLQTYEAEYCLVATGRKAYTEGLGLDNVGIVTDEKGRIPVNEKLQTKVENIYAIGDVIAGPMLAHKAHEEATYVAEVIDGQKPHIKYDLIPAVVYTWPEVASAGYTEEQLKAKGIAYRKGKFPFSASGRARAAGDTEGFVKVLADTRYGEVLGVHIIGPRAADMIAQAVVAMEYEVTAEEMARLCYAHPTYAEGMKEAYLDASGLGTINI